MRLMFLLAITAAVRSIRIGTAYFIPVELFMALCWPRRRGVRVEANITTRAWCGSCRIHVMANCCGQRQDL